MSNKKGYLISILNVNKNITKTSENVIELKEKKDKLIDELADKIIDENMEAFLELAKWSLKMKLYFFKDRGNNLYFLFNHLIDVFFFFRHKIIRNESITRILIRNNEIKIILSYLLFFLTPLLIKEGVFFVF